MASHSGAGRIGVSHRKSMYADGSLSFPRSSEPGIFSREDGIAEDDLRKCGYCPSRPPNASDGFEHATHLVLGIVDGIREYTFPESAVKPSFPGSSSSTSFPAIKADCYGGELR